MRRLPLLIRAIHQVKHQTVRDRPVTASAAKDAAIRTVQVLRDHAPMAHVQKDQVPNKTRPETLIFQNSAVIPPEDLIRHSSVVICRRDLIHLSSVAICLKDLICPSLAATCPRTSTHPSSQETDLTVLTAQAYPVLCPHRS